MKRACVQLKITDQKRDSQRGKSDWQANWVAFEKSLWPLLSVYCRYLYILKCCIDRLNPPPEAAVRHGKALRRFCSAPIYAKESSSSSANSLALILLNLPISLSEIVADVGCFVAENPRASSSDPKREFHLAS